MSKIRRLSDNEEIIVAKQPYWENGVWECGDRRFVDQNIDLYEAIADPQKVPNSVTRFQAKAALEIAGHLEDVKTIMADPGTPVIAKMAWEDALEFFRDSPTVAAISSALGMSSEEVDQLFITASGISA